MAYSATIKDSVGLVYRPEKKKKNKGTLTPTVLFFFLIYVVLVMKVMVFEAAPHDYLFTAYSVGVAIYVLSRFAIAYFYTPTEMDFDPAYEPSVSFAVPSKNEGEHIRETILRMTESHYPKDKYDIIAINDGSTDNTLNEMKIAKRIARERGVEVEIVDWTENRGKRDGMAECVKRSTKDIVVFVDSDSFIEPDAVRKIVKYFSAERIGAVAGQAYVANAKANYLTKMQSVRYFVAFKAYKSSEAIFGSVTCCSGCLAAYRRSVVLPMIDEFREQKFLGAQCTYGDDRSLTNRVLKHGYDAVFAPDSIVFTFVPDNLKQFMRQQFRWKKSWLRESFLAALFMWRKNPIMSISFYLGFILPLVAPAIVLRALVWYPLVTKALPVYYISGLALMAVIYGLYYYRFTEDRDWIYGVIFASFYTLVLIWQLPYALLNIRDGRWGTR